MQKLRCTLEVQSLVYGKICVYVLAKTLQIKVVCDRIRYISVVKKWFFVGVAKLHIRWGNLD